MHEPESTRRLTAGEVVVDVDVAAGGRIGQITVGEQPLLVDVPHTEQPHAMGWGMFPMAPWAGRIRQGRFAFAGVDHQLEINSRGRGTDGTVDDPNRAHSIHGTVHDRAWTVVDETATELTITAELLGALDWPFAGSVRQHIALSAHRIDLELVVSTVSGAFPAEIGWHPWFRKPTRLDFSPTTMYRRDAFGIPNGDLVTPSDGPWDDCFRNDEPVTLHYDRPTARVVRVESDCDHWVVFDEPDHATCVEPQSGPPDAFNLVHHVVTPETPL
ncbi:MAG: hypothetical protein WBP59_05920, partial [Ilumatobacteraceae bacterium]